MIRNQGHSTVKVLSIIVILTLVIVWLSSKFNGMSAEAIQAKVYKNAQTFKTSVKFAHMKWQVLGAPTSPKERNNIQLYEDVGRSGQVDFNVQGYPVKHSDEIDFDLTAHSAQDCQSLWHVLIDHGDDNITDSYKMFIALYEGHNVCSYRLAGFPEYGFTYNTINGNVEVISEQNGSISQ